LIIGSPGSLLINGEGLFCGFSTGNRGGGTGGCPSHCLKPLAGFLR